MKKVISNNTIKTITVSEVSLNKEYLVVSFHPRRIFWLRVEDEGCIFRQVNNMQFGHSGHQNSAKEAIAKILQNYPNSCEILEFDTFLEASRWLVEQTNI